MQGTAADAKSSSKTVANQAADRPIGKKGVSKTITHEIVSEWVYVDGYGKLRGVFVERILRKRRV